MKILEATRIVRSCSSLPRPQSSKRSLDNGSSTGYITDTSDSVGVKHYSLIVNTPEDNLISLIGIGGMRGIEVAYRKFKSYSGWRYEWTFTSEDRASFQHLQKQLTRHGYMDSVPRPKSGSGYTH